MMRNCLFFGSALLLFGVPAFAVPAYTFQTVIDPADTNFTQLLGIDNSGTIAGYFGDGMVVANNGFTLALPGTFTPENYPASLQTQVVGINNTGETVGFFVDGSGVTHGFTDFATILTAVTDPFAPTVTQLLGVNDSGEAAGYYTDGLGNFKPFTWQSGTFTPIPGFVSAQATDVNNAGDIVGFNMTSATTADGFLDIGGSFTTLDFPGSVFTQALGINNVGQVVGDYVDSFGAMHSFVYNIGTGTFQSLDDPNGIGTTTINGINDNGQLVGFYVDGGDNTDGFVGTVVPEPGTLLLMGAAILLGIGLTRWKRRA
jgi:uncharacterized membrane protein